MCRKVFLKYAANTLHSIGYTGIEHGDAEYQVGSTLRRIPGELSSSKVQPHHVINGREGHDRV
jgi:hypothetical protein